MAISWASWQVTPGGDMIPYVGHALRIWMRHQTRYSWKHHREKRDHKRRTVLLRAEAKPCPKQSSSPAPPAASA